MGIKSVNAPRKPEKYQVTGTTGAIAASLAKNQLLQVTQIRVKLSDVGAAGNLTATLNDGTDAKYDTTLATQDMTSVKDYVLSPDIPYFVFPGDSLDVAFANASNRTYGVTFIYQVL